MNYFLVTIKTRGSPYTTSTELDSFLTICKKHFDQGDWSSFRAYELTYTYRLHLHTIVVIPKRVRWLRLLKKVNISNRIYCHLKPFPLADYSNVLSYILKQSPCKEAQDQVLAYNYYHYHDGFQACLKLSRREGDKPESAAE